MHCALDTAVEAASIARKSAATLMSFFHYITHPHTQKLSLTSQVVRFYKLVICPLCETKRRGR
jgi:hypothetical protein